MCIRDRLKSGLDPELLALAGRVGDLRGMQERLGRDAAHVQAGTPQLPLLDQGYGQTELGGPQGAGITTAASTEDHDVERVRGGSRHCGCSLACAHLTGRRPWVVAHASAHGSPREVVQHLACLLY